MRIFLLSFLIFCYDLISAQSNNLGVFTHSSDIGKPKNAGSAQYDTATQTYHLKGSGYNIWFNRDEFQYLYKKLAGDFILTANFEFIGEKGNGHRKTGWMVRESDDEAASSINSVVHGDGLVVMQWRPLRGAYMRDPEDELFFTKKAVYQVIQLERKGNRFIMRVANPGEPLQEVAVHDMPDLKDSVLAGLYICSHDENTYEEVNVWNVRIDRPVENAYVANPQLARKAKPFNGQLASRLETVEIETGKRQIISESEGTIAAPSYSKDGEHIVFNEKQNALELSPDRKYVYYSSNTGGTSQIWRMKRDSTSKEQLTFDEYHNWFPHVSPNGKWLAFISYGNDVAPGTHPAYKKVMLRIMPLTRPGSPRVIAYLYGGDGTLNADSWSPDTKKIAFVSNSEQKK